MWIGIPKPCLRCFKIIADVFMFFLKSNMPFAKSVCFRERLTIAQNIWNTSGIFGNTYYVLSTFVHTHLRIRYDPCIRYRIRWTYCTYCRYRTICTYYTDCMYSTVPYHTISYHTVYRTALRTVRKLEDSSPWLLCIVQFSVCSPFSLNNQDYNIHQLSVIFTRFWRFVIVLAPFHMRRGDHCVRMGSSILTWRDGSIRTSRKARESQNCSRPELFAGPTLFPGPTWFSDTAWFSGPTWFLGSLYCYFV